MLHIIVNKSMVDTGIDCLMSRDRHEHFCVSLCSEKGILSEPADLLAPLHIRRKLSLSPDHTGSTYFVKAKPVQKVHF